MWDRRQVIGGIRTRLKSSRVFVGGGKVEGRHFSIFFFMYGRVEFGDEFWLDGVDE